MSDLIPDSYYDWVFVANTGDQYAGLCTTTPVRIR